jgi:hypothetical protein
MTCKTLDSAKMENSCKYIFVFFANATRASKKSAPQKITHTIKIYIIKKYVSVGSAGASLEHSDLGGLHTDGAARAEAQGARIC